MGRDQIYLIELLNSDSNTHIREKLPSPKLDYQLIVDIIETYYPQVDVQTLTIYYFRFSKWLFLVDSDSFNMDENSNDYQEQGSDSLVFRVRFHCYYFLEQEQQKRMVDDIAAMNQKVENVQQLYHELKDKYKQQALDINVFWGSPLFAYDSIQRSKKPNVFINSLKDKKLNLLTQKVKYQPYINAVSSALEGCEKKVKLYLNQLNKNCFSKKNIFTVVYMMAHLQIEQKDRPKTKPEEQVQNIQKPENHLRYKGKKEQKFQKPYIKKQLSQNANAIYRINISNNRQKSQMQPKKLQEDKEETSDALQEYFQVENKVQNNISAYNEPITEQTTQVQQMKVDREQEQQMNKINSFYNQNNKAKSHNRSQRRRQNKIKSDDRSNYKEEKQYCFLGEELDGSLCKIKPQQLKNSLAHKSRNIQLLILHTSYPYYHLKQLRNEANNIILINSNPLVPEPSTIFFIKQFFTHLVEIGDIQWAYNTALKDLDMLKEITLSVNDKTVEEEFAAKDVQFIRHINQKYVHGSLDCCCCYHQHHPRCNSYQNQAATKFAEYHYCFHSTQCECPMDNINMHSCEAKSQIMIRQYGVITQQFLSNESKFYYCCCQGKEEGYYDHRFKNTQLLLFNVDEQNDVHGIKHKYRHEKKMQLALDNQLQIWQGRLQGDCSQQLLQAFRYVAEHPILGNQKLIIWLLQLFTAPDILPKKQDEETRGLVICNLYGNKSTGRKSIATYFSKLLLIKKICLRVVVKVFNSVDCLKEIFESNRKGRPLLILIHQGKDSHGEQRLSLNASHFPQNVLVIFITEQKLDDTANLGIKFFEPQPFGKTDCKHYVKKYRHLQYETKRNVQRLFDLTGKEVNLYPGSINQFQILNILKKTVFDADPVLGSYNNYAGALAQLTEAGVPTYVFLMTLIRFTKSPNYLKDSNMIRISEKLQEIKKSRCLFYKDYGGRSKEHRQNAKGSMQNQEAYHDELISSGRIRNNYYFIYLCLGHKIVNSLDNIFKLLINYTTVICWHRSSEDIQAKSKIEYLRMKSTPFVQQVYETTTINPDSYLLRFFSKELADIDRITLRKEDIIGIEDFILFHSELFESRRRLLRRLTNQVHSNTKPKDRDTRKNIEMSLDSGSHDRDSREESEKMEEHLDIPHIYHLSSMMEAGLQFLRSVLCSHFVYNFLKEDQKIELLNYGIFLINNCIILMKNQTFMLIQNDQDEYDIESIEHSLRVSRDSFGTSHLNYLETPNKLHSTRSNVLQQSIRPLSARASAKDFFYNQRQFQNMQKSENKKMSQKQVLGLKNDELLSKELYRLSNYKGLLYLLAEIQRRAQEMPPKQTAKIKIQVQLMAIQIRLQQLQLEKQDQKICFPERDRHMARISQIFNDKKYNINCLYRILREQIKNQRFSRDSSELSIIKSYIIVALSLMASSYGRFKIVKTQSVITEIDTFLYEWSQPYLIKQDSQKQVQDKDKQALLRINNLPAQFGFMRFISQNEYIYLFIVFESFSSKKFWKSCFNHFQESHSMRMQKKLSSYSNQARRGTDFCSAKGEIEIYQEILTLYHLFALRSTKNKLQQYRKLQNIQQKLQQYKQIKKYPSLSTYITNFVQTFENKILKQFRDLKPDLIVILNAEDGNNYVKISLMDKINDLVNKKNHKNHFFNVKRKLNQQNIKNMTANGGCKYLCVSTGTGPNDSNKDIILQSNDGVSQTASKEKLAELLGSVSTSAIFVCLPQKKNLAESLERNNHYSRSIVYFNFKFNNFLRFKEGKEIDYCNFVTDEMIIFQKMIMIESVRKIIAGIIEEESNGFRLALERSFINVKNSLCFVLKDNMKRPIMRLTNEQFKKCIFICISGVNQKEMAHSQQFSLCQIELFESERVNRAQMLELDRIGKFTSVKSMHNRDKLINLESKEEFRIDSFVHVHHFMEVFEFYFRDKYGFESVFPINLELLGYDIKKKFMQKLVGENILDLIFSYKKGIIALYVDFENSYKYQDAFKQCEAQLKSILKSCDEMSGKRIISRLMGAKSLIGNKKVANHIYIYFLQQSE